MHVERLCPKLDQEQRSEAAENLSRYFNVVGKIYDHLEDEGKLEGTMLRVQYEKRRRKNPASQNANEEKDDIPTSTGDSNEFTSLISGLSHKLTFNVVMQEMLKEEEKVLLSSCEVPPLSEIRN